MEVFLKQLEKLTQGSYGNIVHMVKEIVATFHPVGVHPTGN